MRSSLCFSVLRKSTKMFNKVERTSAHFILRNEVHKTTALTYTISFSFSLREGLNGINRPVRGFRDKV